MASTTDSAKPCVPADELADVVGTLHRYAAALRELLDQERQALRQRDMDATTRAADEKRRLLLERDSSEGSIPFRL